MLEMIALEEKARRLMAGEELEDIEQEEKDDQYFECSDEDIEREEEEDGVDTNGSSGGSEKSDIGVHCSSGSGIGINAAGTARGVMAYAYEERFERFKGRGLSVLQMMALEEEEEAHKKTEEERAEHDRHDVEVSCGSKLACDDAAKGDQGPLPSTPVMRRRKSTLAGDVREGGAGERDTGETSPKSRNARRISLTKKAAVPYTKGILSSASTSSRAGAENVAIAPMEHWNVPFTFDVEFFVARNLQLFAQDYLNKGCL